MKVILSVEPVRFPLTGIGRYTYELAQGLMSVKDISQLKLFSGVKFISELPRAGEQTNAAHGIRRLVQKSGFATEAYRLAMPLLRSLALRGNEDFIYHGPNFFLPPFAGKKVATFHDLSPFKWTQCHDPVKVRYLQKELRKTLDSADALITDSEFTRRELAEFSGWPLERIHAVPLASAHEFHPRSEAEIKPILARYNLVYQRYTLFVGTIEPRKNIISLLDAYSQLPTKLRQHCPLVLSGYRGWQSDVIHDRIKRAEREGWVRYLGFFPTDDLPDLYAGARLFAFPSLYEGFGLPVLEAMASGVPVVCSDSSSLPEVVGDVALMAEPMNVDALAENLRVGIENNEWREIAAKKSRLRALEFSWERCALATVNVYRHLG